MGYIPSPIDRSHLSKFLYTPNDFGRIGIKSITLPSKYDIREHNYITRIRNQNPWGTCWAHAAIGSSESNFLKKYAQSNSEINLSEMHLAYFVYGDTRSGKSFGKNDNNEDILNQGGTTDQAVAFLSRTGFVAENELKHPTGVYSYTKPAGNPEDYTKILQIADVYEFDVVNSNNRNLIKQMIMQNGAVNISYYAGAGAYSPDSSVYTYFDNTHGTLTNHAVLLIGWDDNFSKDNFKGTKPSSNGAWLVRNSWGKSWGDKGYFWMSYEQYITDAMSFIVEELSDELRYYGYDDLGHLRSIGGVTYAANVFKTKDSEILKKIAFYTNDRNTGYEIHVYDLGTAVPSSPINGSKIFTTSGTYEYAGYHTLDLNTSDDVIIEANHYFSVITKLNTSYSYPIAVEADGLKWYSGETYASPVINSKESYFSSDGTNWTDGYSYSPRNNACIKAFTVVNNPSSFEIKTNKLIDGNITEEYYYVLHTTGANNLKWNISSGSLPTGITLNADTGCISGRASTPGTYSFTVTAQSGNLSAQKAFTFVIQDIVRIDEVNFPDSQFRKYVLDEFDVDNNSILSQGEISCLKAQDISLYNKQISSLKGIEYFTDLTYLSCWNNKLTELDVSKNTALTSLYCYSNQLTVLDITQNKSLKTLYCS